jgi:hypothetical protein
MRQTSLVDADHSDCREGMCPSAALRDWNRGNDIRPASAAWPDDLTP